MTAELVRSAITYLVAIGLLSYYGAEVCPFLDSLTVAQLVGVHAVACAMAFALRTWLIRRVHRKEAGAAVPDTGRPWQYLRIDLGCWVLIGALVTAWDTVAYSFPVGSGLKVVLGCLTLGIYTSTSLALDVEQRLIQCLAREGSVVAPLQGRFLSITTRFMAFIGVSVVVLAGVLLLLVYKDLDYVVHQYETDTPFEIAWVVREVLFVFAVLLGGTYVVLRKYSRNMRLMFELQLEALHHVEAGELDASVPVVSHDEFSTIAEHTNAMIAGLRERERIRSIFGKYVSAPVAEEILESEGGDALGGREVQVAVLFTDLRNFTPFAESCSPPEVVQILNEYFTRVVNAIHRHQGVLDKFIGDAAMGVFGLGGDPNCGQALSAAREIRAELADMNRGLEARNLPTLDNGVGIHIGPVVAGNIGSAERLEYTVIGDAVNTAARLESLTKEVQVPVLVSQDVYDRLADNARADLQPLGAHVLKGKAEPMPVYGLSA
ncbi:adenylate/guanylate cyclase domain-containing protein [Candidatus Latescibacterota bacterium]